MQGSVLPSEGIIISNAHSLSISIYPIKIRQRYKLSQTRTKIKPKPLQLVKEQLQQTKRLYTIIQKDTATAQNAIKVVKPFSIILLKHMKLQNFEFVQQMYSKTKFSTLSIEGSKIGKPSLQQIRISSIRRVEKFILTSGADENEKQTSIDKKWFSYLTRQIGRFNQLKVLDFDTHSTFYDWIPAQEIRAFLDIIAKFKQLQIIKLNLGKIIFLQEFAKFLLLDIIQNLPRLTGFFLSYSIYHEGVFSWLFEYHDKVFSLCKSLEQLSISGKIDRVTQLNKIYHDVGRMPQLKLLRLKIYVNEGTFIDYNEFKKLKTLTNLEDFNVVDSNYSKLQLLDIFASLSFYKSLKCFSFRTSIENHFNKELFHDEPLSFIPQQIEHFQLILQYPIYSECMSIICCMNKLTNIKNISLDFEKLKGDSTFYDLLSLIQETCVHTFSLKVKTVLDLEFDHEFAFFFLKYLKYIKTIVSIKIEMNTVKCNDIDAIDNAIDDISSGDEFPEVLELFENCKKSDKSSSIMYLLDLKRSTQLRNIEIQANFPYKKFED